MALLFTNSNLYSKKDNLKIHYFSSTTCLNEDSLVECLAELNSQAFDRVQSPSEKDTRRRLKLTDSVLVAVESDTPVGFATFRFLSCGRYLVLYQSRGIIPQARRHGLGAKFSQLGIELYLPDILAGRAQNPASILSFMRLEQVDVVYPIEKLYDEDKSVQEALKNLVEQKGGTGKVNLQTGLQKSAYSVGRLGGYKIDQSHPEIARIEQRFIQLGLERDKGDAIYYMAKVKTQK